MVSVIVSPYNAEASLRQMQQAALADLRNLRVMIADDGSTGASTAPKWRGDIVEAATGADLGPRSGREQRQELTRRLWGRSIVVAGRRHPGHLG